METKIENWLNSGEYISQLNNMRTSIMKDVSTSKSESETASIFETNLYYTIRKETGIELNFNKESKLDNINHKFEGLKNRTSGKGRLDAIVNSLVIEYKHFSKLQKKEDIDKAIAQVEDYLNALYKNDGIKYNAILTDGLKISYFSFVDENIEHSTLKEISVKDLNTIVTAILNSDTKSFVPQNILKDFSIYANVDTVSKLLSKELFNLIMNAPTEKTLMLLNEWENLMHLSVNDDIGQSKDIEKRRNDLSQIFEITINNSETEYKALYALQTTYAIIVKLIACKVIDKLNYNNKSSSYFDLSQISSIELQKFLEGMEDGYSYKSNNIDNLLEGDFFSWYSDANQWNDGIYIHIKESIQIIDKYSAFSFNIHYNPIDIFKDLYMSIIPKSIRHSMGEYFTPKWLSDYVVENSTNDLAPNWKAIDPCCGSGIFIISLIKKIVGDVELIKLSDEEKEQLKKQILSRVYGIDINPLSVLSARVGYFMALLPLGRIADIEIPVYLGDSAIVPKKIAIDKIECYSYTIVNNKLPFEAIFPVRFVKSCDFEKNMNELQSLVKTDKSEILYLSIFSQLTDEEKQSDLLQLKIQEMASNLVTLHKNHWDGVWIRIITNFMMIARFSEFDLIVGNPPWVKWEHLPAAYASRIKEFCDVKHIFCNDGGQYGGTQLNICALIANVTATNWLSKDGVLAFLMPDSIMSQNSYEEFRNFYIDYENNIRLYLNKIDRWLSPLRPFRYEDKAVTQDFNTYYFSYKEIDYKKGIPVKNISRNKKISDETINKSSSYLNAKKYLDFFASKAIQLSDNSTAFSYSSNEFDYSSIIGETAYTYRTGVEFTPQELYMLNGIGKSTKEKHYRFKKKEFALSKYKVSDMPENGWDLPTEYIYPMLTAPNIVPFFYDRTNEYCIVPYSKEDIKNPVKEEELLLTNKELYLYLSKHIELIDSQSAKSKMMHRGKEFYALSKIGSYTFAPYIVAARDNSKFCATVVKPSITDWKEEKHTICVKHTIIISQKKDGSFISEDEAHYICGILNSDIVKSYIENTFKSNGYSLNKSNLNLPEYDESNSLHKEIVDLVKNVTPDSVKSVTKKITDIYLSICKNT